MGASGRTRNGKTDGADTPKATKTPKGVRSQTLVRHPHLIMQTPTTAQIRTAIEVLTKLGERLNTRFPAVFGGMAAGVISLGG